jgi:hypothetical protein
MLLGYTIAFAILTGKKLHKYDAEKMRELERHLNKIHPTAKGKKNHRHLDK